jgi:hypothetical protein
VKEPLATIASVLVSKVPEPVTRMVSPVKGPDGAIAVFGGVRLKLFGVAAAKAGGAIATIDARVNRIPSTVNFLFMTIPSSFARVGRLMTRQLILILRSNADQLDQPAGLMKMVDGDVPCKSCQTRPIDPASAFKPTGL